MDRWRHTFRDWPTASHTSAITITPLRDFVWQILRLCHCAGLFHLHSLRSTSGSSFIVLIKINMSVKQNSYMIKFRRTAILFSEENENHGVAEQFGVDRACVILGRKAREQIFKGAATRNGFTWPRQGRHPMLEKTMRVCLQQKVHRFAVTADVMQNKSPANRDKNEDSPCHVPSGAGLNA